MRERLRSGGPLSKLVIPFAPTSLYSDRKFDEATELLRKVPQDAEDYCSVEEMLIRVMASSGDLPGANRTLRAAMISRPGAATPASACSWIAQLWGPQCGPHFGETSSGSGAGRIPESALYVAVLYNYQAYEALSLRVEEARKYGALSPAG